MKTRIIARFIVSATLSFTCIFHVGLAGQASGAPVVLETATLRLEVKESGAVHSLKAKPAGREFLARADEEPVAMVYCGGEWAYETGWTYAHAVPPKYVGGRAFPATTVALAGERLTIGFGGADVTVTYKVTKRGDHLTLELAEVRGGPVHHLDLLRLPLKQLPNHGAWINLVSDDDFGVCLCAGNVQTDATAELHEGHLTLKASAETGSGLGGARAATLRGRRSG